MSDTYDEPITRLERLDHLEERMSMTEATVAELQDAVTALTAAFNTFAADVNTTIADLEAREAGGGSITTSDLGPIKDSLSSLTASVTGADTTVKGEDPGQSTPAAPQPDKPVYLHDTDGSTEGWTPSGFQVPAVPAVAEVPAVPADPSTGAAEVPAKPAEPEVPAKPLWYFDQDAVGGQPTGANEGIWSVYTGPTEPVPAATTEDAPGESVPE